MGKFDVLSNGLPFSMDKTKNYVKRDDGTVEEILDLANLANTEVGILTEINISEKMNYPERIIGTFYKKEKQEFWNDIEVKGRYWVKIK